VSTPQDNRSTWQVAHHCAVCAYRMLAATEHGTAEDVIRLAVEVRSEAERVLRDFEPLKPAHDEQSLSTSTSIVIAGGIFVAVLVLSQLVVWGLSQWHR
jgi:hypothetical protein